MVEEIKKKAKKFNWYRVEDILVIIVICSILSIRFCKTSKEIPIIIGFFSSSLFWVILFLLFAPATTVLKNDSNKKIKALSEDGGEIIEIDPGAEAVGIDGVKINGKVYKLNNGIHAKIRKDESLKIKTVLGNIVNKSGGDILTEAPDEKWQKLFDAE